MEKNDFIKTLRTMNFYLLHHQNQMTWKENISIKDWKQPKLCYVMPEWKWQLEIKIAQKFTNESWTVWKYYHFIINVHNLVWRNSFCTITHRNLMRQVGINPKHLIDVKRFANKICAKWLTCSQTPVLIWKSSLIDQKGSNLSDALRHTDKIVKYWLLSDGIF